MSFYFRLERKQATHTAEKFGKVFGPAFVGIRATEKQKEFSRKLYTNIIKSIDLHFPIGTTVAAPTAPTISLKEDSEVPVGYIAVRVNNYQVTSLISAFFFLSKNIFTFSQPYFHHNKFWLFTFFSNFS